MFMPLDYKVLGKNSDLSVERSMFMLLDYKSLAKVHCRLLAKTSTRGRSMAFERLLAQEWKSVQGAVIESGNLNGCFDCNICLEYAYEPVVTLCGHLYCWPCIYKWLHVQSASLASDEHPQCPVCKAEISHTAMVPLYGRGQGKTTKSDLDEKSPHRGIAIPPRPAACGNKHFTLTPSNSGQQLPYRNPYQSPYANINPLGSHVEDSSSPSVSSGVTGIHSPNVGMFGEMVFARVFGSSDSIYGYPNSYPLAGATSPRARRQELQADKSLNRISIFLFCCLLLCLIVF